MGTLITITQFILALAILVTLHELGHYLAARMFGIRVEKFYLFFDAFGVKLFKFKKGDTEYGVGWLPLGGYVKIAGMIDESLDTKQMASKPEDWEFRSKPAWQRLIVMIGGVTVNLILGIGIMVVDLWVNGKKYLPNEVVNNHGGYYFSPAARKFGFQVGDQIKSINNKKVDDLEAEFIGLLSSKERKIVLGRASGDTVIYLPQNFEEIGGGKHDLPIVAARQHFKIRTVMAGSPADKAGLKTGDKILTIDSQDSRVFWEFREIILTKKGKKVNVQIESKGQVSNKTIEVTSDGTIGFNWDFTGFDGLSKQVSYGFGGGVVQGTRDAMGKLGASVTGFRKVITGELNAKKSVAGPIGIAQMFGPVWDWQNFWALTAVLSLVLAFMNILPIPALDGGHVMFLLWEVITRRPVNEKVLFVGQIVGMVLLAALIIFIFWVDIARLLGF